jgi:flagellar biosynthesis chaperone FliJ
MRDISHLHKYHFVIETQEKNLLQKIAENQKKQDQEKRKYDMLSNCLLETRNNLHATAEISIQAIAFAQYQHFINQLEKALKQQNDVLNGCKMIHDKYMVMYKEIKLKRIKLNELMDHITQENTKIANRKENQVNTEIYNRLNRPS